MMGVENGKEEVQIAYVLLLALPISERNILTTCSACPGRNPTQELLGREATSWLLLSSWPRCHGVGTDRKRLFRAWCLVLQTAKAKDPACGPKDGKSLFSGLATGESSWSQHRQRRLQDHGKERKELLSLTLQVWRVLSIA